MVYWGSLKEGKFVEEIRKDKIINIPNLLTMLRIALLPAVAWRFLKQDTTGALILYLISMLTDALDGVIARKTNQITALGKLLDPIADKLALITLLTLFVVDGQIPIWILVVMLAKEIVMVCGAAVAFKRGIIVYALPIGKVTTVAFVLSMVMRFLEMRQIADMLLNVSVVLSIVALVWYTITLMRTPEMSKKPAL